MLAYIVGNGLSRKPFDLNLIKTNGLEPHYGKAPIFCCNAAYRDFDCDYLVALDKKIIEEINNSTFPKHKFIIPPINEQYESQEYHNGKGLTPRNNAAMIAMNEAIKFGYKHLVCLGMDFVIEDKELNLGNIYDGTNAYGPETRASFFDTIARFRYMDWFASKHSDISFEFLFPEDYHFREFTSKNIKIYVMENNDESSQI